MNKYNTGYEVLIFKYIVTLHADLSSLHTKTVKMLKVEKFRVRRELYLTTRY